MAEQQLIIHGYWGIRGAGQVSRLLLTYCGANWKDTKYFSPQQWFNKDINELNLPCPNLPYLIDGDFKLTESSAIQKYIIRKFDKLQLLGKNYKDTALMDMVIGVTKDIKNHIAPLIMDKQWEKKVVLVEQKIKKLMKYLKDFYGQKQFALGYLTLADFFLSQFSYYIQNIVPDLYKQNQFLGRLRQAFQAIEPIQKYYESQDAVQGPFMPPYAQIKF